MMDGPEVVRGSIPSAHEKTGLFSSRTWTLVITDRRLLLAQATSELTKAAIEQARAERQDAGGGFLSQWKGQLHASMHFAERYAAMTPDAILAETAGNLALTPPEVRTVKVERKTEGGGEDSVDREHLRITLETTGGKRTFNTDDETPRLADARALLAATFGPAVR